MKLLKPKTWFRKEPLTVTPTPFIPGSDIQSIRFYQRIKHDMVSPVSPSRFHVFKDKPVDEFERLVGLSWAEHWYGRTPTRDEIDYVFSGQFDADEALRKSGQ